MSVVHEALKRAGGGEAPKEKEPRPSLTVKSPGKQPSWLFWTMLFFVIAEAALCWREHALRLHSEEKMRLAYLELNDARGKNLDKGGTVKRAINESLELRMKLTQVETDNLKKEKKISDLTRRLHESEMEKIKISEIFEQIKPSMDLAGALEYLDSFANYEKDEAVYPEGFKLDRMRSLVRELGNPQNAFESVIIAGSKGKGSTAAILSSILRMENLRVGLYTSPHLHDVSERIQVNGLCINELRLAENLTRIQKATEGYAWRKDPPTYFEVLTALAFCHFKDMKAQVAVLEVGLGGLYDSTNVAEAKVAGITPISLEHTEKLGKTIAKIAVQKCGVIKGREAVVSAAQAPEAQSVIESACEEREAKLFCVGKEIRATERHFDEDSQYFDVRTPWGSFYDLKIHLRGTHQIQNAAQAIGLAKALGTKTRLPVSEEAVRQGVLDAHWPGRLEKFGDRPRIVLDGAHNVESARKMLDGVKHHFQFSKLVVVFGSFADKDVRGMLREISPEADSLVLTQAVHPRAMPAAQVVRLLEKKPKECYEEPSIAQALTKARALAASDGLIVVTGSLYLVAEARKLL